jgi:2-haloacid dehalogenase
MEDIKVLAFDTGGTLLDWHAGLTAAFAAWGAAQGIERDWPRWRTSIAAARCTG